MDRKLDLKHEAVRAAIAAIQRRGHIPHDKEPVMVTGIIERDPLGQLNITDSDTNLRTAISCGWGGELHIRIDFQPARGA